MSTTLSILVVLWLVALTALAITFYFILSRKLDEIDSSRAASPLKPAEDAVHLDSTGKTIEEIISFICSRAEQAQG